MWVRALAVASVLLALQVPAASADPMVCVDATRCVGVDDEGRACTPVGCFAAPVEDGEVHHCNQLACAHAIDDEDDGEIDYVVVAGAADELVDCRSYAWTSGRGWGDCTASDEPDELEHRVLVADYAWNLTGTDDSTRFHEASAGAGAWSTEDGGFTYAALATAAARARDTDGDGFPDHAGAEAHGD